RRRPNPAARRQDRPGEEGDRQGAPPARQGAFFGDGKSVLARGVLPHQSPQRWTLDGKLLQRYEVKFTPCRAYPAPTDAVSPDRKLVAAAGQDKLVRLWDADKGTEVRVLRGHAGDVSAVAFTPDGKRILTGGDDKTVRLWDAASGAEIISLSGHTHRVWSIAVSAAGKHAFSASFDKTV